MQLRLMHLSPMQNVFDNPQDVAISTNEEYVYYPHEEGQYVADQIRDIFHDMMSKGYQPDMVVLGEIEYKKLICYLSENSSGFVFPTSYMGLQIVVSELSQINVTFSNISQALTWNYFMKRRTESTH